MNDFVASNGIRIVAENDHLKVTATDNRVRYLLQDSTVALREFFLAERDAELGRWRSKEHPDCLVYFSFDGRVIVVNERNGVSSPVYERGQFPGTTGLFAKIALEYFSSHPERKPWHDAKEGESWLIVVDNAPKDVTVVKNDSFGEEFISSSIRCSIKYTGITYGKRIWPKGT